MLPSLYLSCPTSVLISAQASAHISAYQSRARQSFSPPPPDNPSPSAGLIKHRHATISTVAGAHRPPCVGKPFLLIIPLCSKSSPAPALLGNAVFVEQKEKKVVCENRGIKHEEGKSDLLLDKCAGTRTSLHTLSKQKSNTIFSCISFLIQRPQIPIKPPPWSKSAECQTKAGCCSNRATSKDSRTILTPDISFRY